jgi:hypothetical protein
MRSGEKGVKRTSADQDLGGDDSYRPEFLVDGTADGEVVFGGGSLDLKLDGPVVDVRDDCVLDPRMQRQL